MAGERMLLMDIISTRASICASTDKRNMDGHLIAVEVRVEGGAYERMQSDGLAFNQHRIKRLNAEIGARSEHDSAAQDARE